MTDDDKKVDDTVSDRLADAVADMPIQTLPVFGR